MDCLYQQDCWVLIVDRHSEIRMFLTHQALIRAWNGPQGPLNLYVQCSLYLLDEFCMSTPKTNSFASKSYSTILGENRKRRSKSYMRTRKICVSNIFTCTVESCTHIHNLIQFRCNIWILVLQRFHEPWRDWESIHAKDPHFVPAGMYPGYPHNHADIGPTGHETGRQVDVFYSAIHSYCDSCLRFWTLLDKNYEDQP